MRFPTTRHGWLSRALLIVSLTSASCSGGASKLPPTGSGFHGVVVSSPIPKPSFTLTDFNGAPYDFVKETADKVALLFFGYTHCPDICPLHMANIAAVLRTIAPEERRAVRVVFVTTDPERDTPVRLREWLGKFDPDFVGLTGSVAEVGAIEQTLGIPPAEKETPTGDSAGYGVGHAAQVFAFSRDGNAYLIYPGGIRQEDWAHDLPKLARDSTGETTRAELGAGGSGPIAITPATSVTARGLEISGATVAEPVTQSETALYFTVHNGTPQSDTLLAVLSDAANMISLHDSFSGGRMAPIASVPVAPGGTVTFEPGGRHAMLMELRRELHAGDSLTLRILFRRLGVVEVKAGVVKYEKLQQAVGEKR